MPRNREILKTNRQRVINNETQTTIGSPCKRFIRLSRFNLFVNTGIIAHRPKCPLRILPGNFQNFNSVIAANQRLNDEQRIRDRFDALIINDDSYSIRCERRRTRVLVVERRIIDAVERRVRGSAINRRLVASSGDADRTRPGMILPSTAGIITMAGRPNVPAKNSRQNRFHKYRANTSIYKRRVRRIDARRLEESDVFTKLSVENVESFESTREIERNSRSRVENVESNGSPRNRMRKASRGRENVESKRSFESRRGNRGRRVENVVARTFARKTSKNSRNARAFVETIRKNDNSVTNSRNRIESTVGNEKSESRGTIPRFQLRIAA